MTKKGHDLELAKTAISDLIGELSFYNGMTPGMTLGMTPGMTLGMTLGMTPGMTPGMTLGMTPGMTLGMTPLT